jgi:SOS-response transcriptional repressor LexA
MEKNGRKKKNDILGLTAICFSDWERLTEKERVMMEFMAAYTREHGYVPAFRDLCELTGCASPLTTLVRVWALEMKGFISRRHALLRAIALLEGRLAKWKLQRFTWM